MAVRFLTRDQVAQYLAVNVRTVDKLVRSGSLRAIKIGSNVRISEQSYTKLVKSRAV